MTMIQWNIQGALDSAVQFDPDAVGVVRTVANGRIIFDTAPPLTFGRFDIASLLGFSGRPMVVFNISISVPGSGPAGDFGVVGPTAPLGATGRGVALTPYASLPGVGNGLFQTPQIIPSGHLLQVTSGVTTPVTLLLSVDQLKSGSIVSEITRGALTP